MHRRQSGQTVIEVLVAIGLAAILLPALATSIVASREGRAQEAERLQATALARQADEAVRSVREKGWTNISGLTAGSPYRPTVAANAWTLTAGAESIGTFTRQVVASDVQRNAAGAIVASGGIVDQSTRKLTITVSWTQPATGSVVLEDYYQRYMGNAAWNQTTQAEFAAGTETNTLATATGGGQVELAPNVATPALVQSQSLIANPTATTIALAFPAKVSGGDLIVAAISWDTAASTTVTCTDNLGNTYTTAVNTNDTTNTQAQAICYAPNAIGGITTVTATFGASSVSRRIAIHEYSGVALTAPVDVSKTNVANNTTAANNATTANMTTTVANDLIFGALTETGAANNPTITVGTGFTMRQNPNTDTEIFTQDRLLAAPGAIASTNTIGTASRYVAQEVAFKPLGTPSLWSVPGMASVVDVAGVEDNADVQVVGNYAYVADATILRIYDVTDPDLPVAMGTYTAGGIINGLHVSGNFVYLATSNTAGELTIVDAANKSTLSTEATVNLANTEIALSVYVANNTAYIGRAFSATAGRNEFYTYNVSTPATPVLQDSLDTTAQINAIYVPTANHAYLATSITGAEITVINVTTPTNISAAGVYDANGTSIGADITGDGTHVFLVKANNTTGAEFFELTPNTTVPTAVTFTLNGSYEAGANINGVAVLGNMAFIATAITNAQLRVLNITTPAAITVTGSLNVAGVANKVDAAGNYAYLATANDTREFVIAQATPSIDGNTIELSGTFESSSFDATASAAFNYMTFTVNEPAGANVTFQVATNNDNATWNYIGPDGTAGTSYSTPVALRLNTLGRYIRYKATLTGTGFVTPTFSDTSINYSP